MKLKTQRLTVGSINCGCRWSGNITEGDTIHHICRKTVVNPRVHTRIHYLASGHDSMHNSVGPGQNTRTRRS